MNRRMTVSSVERGMKRKIRGIPAMKIIQYSTCGVWQWVETEGGEDREGGGHLDQRTRTEKMKMTTMTSTMRITTGEWAPPRVASADSVVDPYNV
jgi:hypothetical protein